MIHAADFDVSAFSDEEIDAAIREVEPFLRDLKVERARRIVALAPYRVGDEVEVLTQPPSYGGEGVWSRARVSRVEPSYVGRNGQLYNYEADIYRKDGTLGRTKRHLYEGQIRRILPTVPSDEQTPEA